MIPDQCARGSPFADLIDYWVGDLDQESAGRVEVHVFECRECADCLAEIAAMAAAVAEAVRGGHVETVITDAILNKLSRDGVRIRTFVPERDKFIPCAVWPDDDIIVGRYKGDFSAYDNLTLVMKMDEGPELGRMSDIPLVSGPYEILTAISAAQLRQLPAVRLRMTLSGTREGREEIVGEYGLEHGGAMNR